MLNMKKEIYTNIREEDKAVKKDGGTVDWNYLLSRID